MASSASFEHPGTPTVIDVEASGFGRGSYPIEIGFVRGDGESQCHLVRPRPEWTHWDPQAEALHGISRDTLERFGRDVREVAAALNEALDATTVYSDAWGNDRTWLAVLFDAAGMAQRFKIETLRILLSEAETDIWNQTKRDVLENLELERHRASTDALVLQRTYQRLRAKT
ncbi:MAG: hypothetical protein K0U93_09390 [Gammaproteobacteria bacterium]|nr:hypothetical protein [Gammaproteobacteria bacterium]